MSRITMTLMLTLGLALLIVALEGRRLVTVRAQLQSDRMGLVAIEDQVERYELLLEQSPSGAADEPLDHRAIAAVSAYLESAGATAGQIESITVSEDPATDNDGHERAGDWTVRVALRRVPMRVIGQFGAAMHNDVRAWRSSGLRISSSRLTPGEAGHLFDVDVTYRPTRPRDGENEH
jgi:hypothetical protein